MKKVRVKEAFTLTWRTQYNVDKDTEESCAMIAFIMSVQELNIWEVEDLNVQNAQTQQWTL